MLTYDRRESELNCAMTDWTGEWLEDAFIQREEQTMHSGVHPLKCRYVGAMHLLELASSLTSHRQLRVAS